MTRSLTSRTAALLGLCLLAGCTLLKPQASQIFSLNEEELREGFDQSYAWEQYTDAARGIQLGVEDGVYAARIAQPGIIWGLNAQQHTDVVIQVDTEQRSDALDNGYGLMCRATESNNGDGYYFLISGDGAFTIRRGMTDTFETLIAWTPHDAIQQGRAINRIRAVCIGDYLALYANGQFLGETRDRRYTHGYAGLVVAATQAGASDVSFDALTIWAASLNTP